ncbi:MAG: YebC/PmpR family DNA-binding transcriptional regulator [Pseudomonadota bacterium]|nr:YebC/PmpR family DNA-binding transcriptional regulator [Pseudomonadota bacterium]
MAGHSQFKNIMHRKGAQDAKRAKLFAKLAREITVAAKIGVPDPKQNSRLRNAILNARSENMPNDRIKKALLKASTNNNAENYDEIRYEGFGNNGISLIIETLTDNKNRTASELRSLLTKNGGNLGETGSATFNFQQLGEISFDPNVINKEEVEIFAIENGASEIFDEEDVFKVLCDPNNFNEFRNLLEKNFKELKTSKLIWHPINLIEVNDEEAKNIFKIIESLEEIDDVQNIYTNVKISKENLKALDGV